ncbi:hypothetical protein [Spiroplasma endosymbiont of Dioctria linearis]|uniref:hypothetical protein n=1 Tax=Spiroplasma endosymbiont of Dioctria linearis TaxID=3066290 RepID=UPI00313B99CD
MAGGVCEPCFFRFFLEDRLTYWKTEGVYQLKLGFEEILICDVCYIRDGEYMSADTMKVMCEVDFQEFSKHEKTYVVEGKQITCECIQKYDSNKMLTLDQVCEKCRNEFTKELAIKKSN